MIIAITGCLEDSHGNRRIAGAGKDEAAKALVDHGFVSVAFADIMKRWCKELYGFTDEQLWSASDRRTLPDKRYYRGLQHYVHPAAPVGAVWIPLVAGRGFTLISAGDYENVSRLSLSLNKKEAGKSTDYVRVYGTDGKLMLHQYLMGDPPPGRIIDHINGDGLDNRRENLRFCTQAENRQNQKPRKDAASPFKGVSEAAHHPGHWRAGIRVHGEQIALGVFEREDQAAAAYDKAALEKFGSFARRNKNMFLTPRYALQKLGDWGRDCFPDIWANKALEIAKELLKRDDFNRTYYLPKEGVGYTKGKNDTPGVVIPDCRFQNEFHRVKEEGGSITRIKRFVNEFPDVMDDSHVSERDILAWGDEKFDHVISNNDDVGMLHQKVLVALGLQSIAFPPVVSY